MHKIRYYCYRTLVWARDRLPPGVRSLLGLLFCVGGVFGFLPILGFWMLPLGACLIGLDVPFARSKLNRVIERLEAEVTASAASSPPPPEASQTPPSGSQNESR